MRTLIRDVAGRLSPSPLLLEDYAKVFTWLPERVSKDHVLELLREVEEPEACHSLRAVLSKSTHIDLDEEQP